MNENRLRGLLEQLSRGEIPIEEAIRFLRDLPFEQLDFATVDHHREIRTGVPEVVYAAGKTPAQVATIAASIASKGSAVLVTRAGADHAEAVLRQVEGSRYHDVARVIHRPAPEAGATPRRGRIAIVAAGTSDLPVAEEAAVVAEALGNPVGRIYDVGVAGLHRLLSRRPEIQEASVVIVVAGMEAALGSVVGGMVGVPVIAVPTSVGYGTSFGGLTALLGLLSSCAPGVTVVGIDNGFGAAYAASLINRRQAG